jgi:hypothetical protein
VSQENVEIMTGYFTAIATSGSAVAVTVMFLQ